MLETGFSWTLSIILVISFSILYLHDDFPAGIFSFELLVAHLDEHIIIDFVRPSAFQLSCDTTVIAHLIHFILTRSSVAGTTRQVVVVNLLLVQLVVYVLKIF